MPQPSVLDWTSWLAIMISSLPNVLQSFTFGLVQCLCVALSSSCISFEGRASSVNLQLHMEVAENQSHCGSCRQDFRPRQWSEGRGLPLYCHLRHPHFIKSLPSVNRTPGIKDVWYSPWFLNGDLGFLLLVNFKGNQVKQSTASIRNQDSSRCIIVW